MRPIRALLAVLPLAALWVPASLDAQSRACDRACLAGIMTRYLDSLVAHDPKKAPLADNVRFTEDAVEMPVGSGLWKTASKLRPFRTDFLDVREGTAAVHAVLEENGTPVLLAARLKVVDRRIAEIETIVVRNQAEGALFAPDALAKPSAAMTARPPKAQLMPREQMAEIALRYPEGLRVGSFEKSDVPFAPNAYRLENGVRMAGPGCTFRPPSCENMRSQQLPTLVRDEAERRRGRRRERHGAVVDELRQGLAAGPAERGQGARHFRSIQDLRRPSACRGGGVRRHGGEYDVGLDPSCRPTSIPFR